MGHKDECEGISAVSGVIGMVVGCMRRYKAEAALTIAQVSDLPLQT